MKLRIKILSGFLILATMLAGAGVLSIHELLSIGSSVNRLLNENYRSIDAAQIMGKALEAEDTGTLLWISGKWQEGRSMIETGDSSFLQAFQVARNNITIPNENEYVDKIDAEYRIYKALWMHSLSDPQKDRNLDWYFLEAHKAFKAVKQSVEELIELNDEAMYRTASNLYGRANRAIMPGIVAILSSLVFVLIFNYFINYYIIKPIAVLTREVRTNISVKKPIEISIETKDELHDLALAIKELALERHKTV